jgi:ACS family tartrate transporter-like MFS transporter
MDELVEKSAIRKIYLRLLPFAIISYFLAYIDRINVSFAALTMRDDLSISAAEYGFALGTFYWGYFIFEVPSNVIMEKVGARIWIARIMISWGILAGLTATVTGQPALASSAFSSVLRRRASSPASCCISHTGFRPTIMPGLCRAF